MSTETPVALAGGTKISWADYTYNPWWGCARVSRACDGCYAEAWAKRTGHAIWGKTADRRLFGDKHWNDPVRWDKKAGRDGVRRRVFCASMADVFEARDDLDEHRARLWDLIAATPNLDWLLLTKRPEQINARVPSAWLTGWPANVWVGTTVEDQKSAVARIPHLQAVPARIRFLSCEPLLERIEPDLDGIAWVIAGGETGPNARPPRPDWFRALRDQCTGHLAPVAFHLKQWGDWLPVAVSDDPDAWGGRSYPDPRLPGARSPLIIRTPGPSGTMRNATTRPMIPGDRTKACWMLDDDLVAVKVGHAAAGRELDGREWLEFPS